MPFEDSDTSVGSGWEGKGLDGRATFLSFFGGKQAVMDFDFGSGTLEAIYFAPDSSILNNASLNPNLQDFVLAYAPPPSEGSPQYGYSDLYRISPGESEPGLLLERPNEKDYLYGSFYGPKGEYVYFNYWFDDQNVALLIRNQIRRLNIGSGQVETLVEDGNWPRVSPDGTMLAFLTLNPNPNPDEPDTLMVANSDGSNPRSVVDPDAFPTVDAPFFSPDNAYLYFSAVSETTPALSWLDRLFGVRMASAHNVPSDWWRVDLATGDVEQITEILETALYGAFSPDGQHIGFICSTGLYVMNPDGSDLVKVIGSPNFYGTLEWAP